VLWRRHFTIMVVPDARAGLRRFHVKGSHLIIGAVVAGVLVSLALALPVVAWSAHATSDELASVSHERDRLAGSLEQVDGTLRDLMTRLDRFERRTEKLATLAGLDLPGLAGQGVGAGTSGSSMELMSSRLQREAEQLSDRSRLIGRRLDTVEELIAERSERLSRTPSILPVRGLLTSGFSWRRHPFTGRRQFHPGLDVAAPEGTPVHAPADGVVVKTERHGGYGKVLYVSHGDGITTRYGHLLEYRTRPGERVRRGDVVGLVGNTGRSTGPHLHYEVLVHGKQVDPMKYVMDGGLF
jgi:murein DD-endopeptidase MepM/ murein hydrolase activator NlpD